MGTDGWAEGWADGRGRRERAEGEGAGKGVVSQKKKGEKLRCLLLRRKKEKYYYFIYDVITWEKFHKRSSTYYSGVLGRPVMTCRARVRQGGVGHNTGGGGGYRLAALAQQCCINRVFVVLCVPRQC